ncbi:MAG: Polyribonucleotide nucleotidyltransferase [Candidatus Taylorbacteria bacterium]|nr:Polyribonucleotide nucleotidyltransferase [Candidatus Taylorbacteria bacterium]
MQSKEYTLDVAGFPMTATFTDLADQAQGSVILSYRDTTLLATACMGKHDKESDFFPLTVDLEERFYAAGKILGSQYIRREGRPSDDAILAGRVVDRTIRPLFDHHIRREIQVVVTTLALGEVEVDTLAVIAGSLALATSNIPFNGPVSAVHIGYIGGQMVVNPSFDDVKNNPFYFDVTVCGKDNNVTMIETVAKQISNDVAGQALDAAVVVIEKIQTWQKQIVSEIGKTKTVLEFKKAPEGMVELFAEKIESKFYDAVFTGSAGKESMSALNEEWMTVYKEKFPEEKTFFAYEYIDTKINDIIHKEAIEKGKRPDGRTIDEVRPLFAKAGGISKVLHGSGIFYRGGTHVFSAVTLGAPGDAQTIETIKTSGEKRFMHHYNFAPYSVGEPGRMGGLNRRMIGHGYLAEKSLAQVIPSKDIFPYTIRLVSESTASNGSTSMGSVCASSLAMMDAGIPIEAPVAGIASGLMMETPEKYALITDIQGPEDHHGDMDFKVAGTRKGITGIQMDIKVGGIPVKILKEALIKAEKARLQILDVMEAEISKPRGDISPRAPKILSIKVKVDQIGLVIGTGGKTIKEMMATSGAEIDIDDDGTVFFTGTNGSAEIAKKLVEDLTKEFVKGEKFEGTVTKIAEFGAFVKIAGNTEGLVHVSEMAPFRVDHVTDYLKEGQVVPVIVKDVDERGRIALSIKQVNPDFFKQK